MQNKKHTFKNIIKYIIINLFLITVAHGQVRPYIEPLSFNNPYYDIPRHIENLTKVTFDKRNTVQQYHINTNNNRLNQFNIEVNILDPSIKFFIINSENNSFVGPYTINDFNNDHLKTDPIKGKNIIVEINNSNILNSYLEITIHYKDFLNTKIDQATIGILKNREEPTILVTGYWPPTNEMIRYFSQNEQLNPDGWEGDNWENSGYDIISYFPSFENPDCSSCGQGYGDLEVDYQDTSNDFWPIAESHNPIAIITFSRGYNNQSWELEFNAYNRTNWIGDYSTPTLPTPNPPDENEDSFFLRNSNLPMNDIIENINNLNLGLDPYIDENGDPGHFVSEFMAYHGTWYRDLNLNGDDRCYLGGHIHVGGQIDTEIARQATKETIRTVIDYLDQFTYTPGDINQDSIIDILDLVIIINNILGFNELSQIEFYSADMNEDAIINIQDVIIIINLILNNS